MEEDEADSLKESDFSDENCDCEAGKEFSSD